MLFSLILIAAADDREYHDTEHRIRHCSLRRLCRLLRCVYAFFMPVYAFADSAAMIAADYCRAA